MSELYRDPARSRYARPGDSNALTWTLGAVGLVAILGFALYQTSDPYFDRTVANPPSVAATPAAGARAPAPDETTGQVRPRAQ
jgi:hypothetical protein